MNAMDEQFTKYTHANVDLDIATKRAALRASASVVGLISVRREGGETLFNASGTIYETSENGDGKYLSRIVTSASLFGSVAHKDIYIKVFTAGDIVFDCIIMGHDAHYNLAIIDIISDVLLPAARLRILDDSVSIDPISVQCSQDNARPHSRKFKICAGDMLVALGRSCKNFDIMAAPGKLSLDYCGYDCMELMMATCIITKPGIGGPIVNCYGEVIGVNFMNEKFTPFLATNIVDKWLNFFTGHKKEVRPWTGVVLATNLYAARLRDLEHIVLNNPKVSKGVFVEAIAKESPAHRAGLKPRDVIIRCNGRSVNSFLKFCCKMLDKGGKSVEVEVVRKGNESPIKIKIDVEEFTSANSWPLPKEHTVRCAGRYVIQKRWM